MNLHKSLALTATKLLQIPGIAKVKIQATTDKNITFTVDSGVQSTSVDLKKLRDQLALQIKVNADRKNITTL